MGVLDPAFNNVKMGQVNFLIWRIENFEVKPLKTSLYGNFYEGDSYIIYSAAPPPGSNVATRGQGKLEYHIHFWLGITTSPDESTTAAIKTVELDDILNGVAIQHRETQGNESIRFKSYFKNGIRILKGGIASGLHHVTDTFTPKLFKIKGMRRPILTEQPSISWKHFNSGDVFILESKTKIFIWVGKESNKMEKFQGGKIAAQLKNEGTKRSIVYIEEDKENELKADDLIEFEEHLTLSERVIQPSDKDAVDLESEENAIRGIALYKCTNEKSTTHTIFLKNGPLKQSDLNSLGSYIIVTVNNGIWVWIGKKAPDEERSNGMKTACDFLKKSQKEKQTWVTRVVDGGEPVEFQILFSDWKDPNASVGFNKQSSVKKTVNMSFDAAKLHEIPTLAAGTQLVDDGSGTTQVWRLHNRELEPVPEDHFGLFFSGDCYLILYTYNLHGIDKYILYFWLGSHSSQDERGAIAWHAIKKDEELNGAAVQVRVIQSKEDPQFLLIFKGKMVIFNGGYASSFDGPEGKNLGIPTKFLLQVRGGDDQSTQSVQVEYCASSLNSNDVFVVYNEKKTYVWCGKGSTGDERERAKAIAKEWSPTNECSVLLEGCESEDFWEILGGKQPYANDERLAQPENIYPARLFHCSNATGYFKAEEILDFSQHDLVPNDVMVLDIGTAVFIWVGKGANKTEKVETLKLVENYLKSDPRDRDIDTPVFKITQGFEPPNFTGFFGAWDKDLWETSLYRELAPEIAEESRIIYHNSEENYQSFSELAIYPLSQLANRRAAELPEDVDVLHRELHLSQEDFLCAFGMSRSEYAGLPIWKQYNLKKQAGLF